MRADMTPKPAYEQLERFIKDKWWTQTKATLEAGGKARFRGFFGQYKVTARRGDRRLTGTFSFDKSTKEPIDVQLS